ncbi:hypothetical protein [Streptomyces phaeochromogenes]|uniref:hypothetical protein n=1 Tax=Streptomyces phaeochromogenes TaxID=1923 RepID=UPI00367F8831
MSKTWSTLVRFGGIAAVLCASLAASPPASGSSPAKLADRFRILTESGGSPNVRLWFNDDTQRMHADITGNPMGIYRAIHLREGYCPHRPSRGSLENRLVYPNEGAKTLFPQTPTSKCEYTAWAEPHASSLPARLSGWWVAP